MCFKTSKGLFMLNVKNRYRQASVHIVHSFNCARFRKAFRYGQNFKNIIVNHGGNVANRSSETQQREKTIGCYNVAAAFVFFFNRYIITTFCHHRHACYCHKRLTLSCPLVDGFLTSMPVLRTHGSTWAVMVTWFKMSVYFRT